MTWIHRPSTRKRSTGLRTSVAAPPKSIFTLSLTPQSTKSSHKSTRCSLRREAVAFIAFVVRAHKSRKGHTARQFQFGRVVRGAAHVHGESVTAGPWPTDRAALFAGVYCWKHTKIPCKTYYPGKAPAGRNIAPPSRPAGRTYVSNSASVSFGEIDCSFWDMF